MDDEHIYRVFEYRVGIVSVPLEILADRFEITASGVAVFYKDGSESVAIRDYSSIVEKGQATKAKWDEKRQNELDDVRRRMLEAGSPRIVAQYRQG